MASPYPAQPVQGNLIGSILDFAQRRDAGEVERATREFLAAQQGLGQNVDPFGVQKFQGEGQRQFLAGEDNSRAWNADSRLNENQGWMRGDRAAVGQMAGAMGQVPGIANDPTLGAILQGASNPAIAGQLLGMLGQDRTSETALNNSRMLAGEGNALGTANSAIAHEYRMKEIKAQNAGRGGPSAAMQMLQEKDKFLAEANEQYRKTRERRMLQEAELRGYIDRGRSHEEIIREMEGDADYNSKNGPPLEQEAKRQAERQSGRASTIGGVVEGAKPTEAPPVIPAFDPGGLRDPRIWPERPQRESVAMSILDNIERALGYSLRSSYARTEDVAKAIQSEFSKVKKDVNK